MTNRDPNQTELSRKMNEFVGCLAQYYNLPNGEKRLKNDLTKPDIDLVCFYELDQIRQHVRRTKLNFTDFGNLNIVKAGEYKSKFLTFRILEVNVKEKDFTKRKETINKIRELISNLYTYIKGETDELDDVKN